MAKEKTEVNKSQAIRGLLSENPKLTTPEVITNLAEKNIEVKSGLVYMIRTKMRRKKHRVAREKASQVAGPIDPVVTIKKVKALAEEVGGLKKLQALVEALAG